MISPLRNMRINCRGVYSVPLGRTRKSPGFRAIHPYGRWQAPANGGWVTLAQEEAAWRQILVPSGGSVWALITRALVTNVERAL